MNKPFAAFAGTVRRMVGRWSESRTGMVFDLLLCTLQFPWVLVCHGWYTTRWAYHDEWAWRIKQWAEAGWFSPPNNSVSLVADAGGHVG